MQLVFPFIAFLVFSLEKYCSCLPPGKIDEKQYNKYDLILKGKVIKIVESEEERRIFLNVDSYYKGEQLKDTIEIISPLKSGVCGIFPSVGEDWLMFAYLVDNKYRTNLCTRTKNMNSERWDYRGEELNEDLQFLEAKRKNNGG